MALVSTAWDDIDNGADFMFVNGDYKIESLTNIMFEMISDPRRKRQVLAKNQHPGLYGDLANIRAHADKLAQNSKITDLVARLFPAHERLTITPLDRVYLNSCYRKLLRAQIEQKYLAQELPDGLIIMGEQQAVADRAMVRCLQLLRIICKFLGLQSTIDPGSFPKSKLTAHTLWYSMSEKFVPLMGEDRIPIIEKEMKVLSPSHNPLAVKEETDLMVSTKSYLFLNIVLMSWSGSILKAEGETVHLVPAVYVTRMLPKLVVW